MHAAHRQAGRQPAQAHGGTAGGAAACCGSRRCAGVLEQWSSVSHAGALAHRGYLLHAPCNPDGQLFIEAWCGMLACVLLSATEMPAHRLLPGDPCMRVVSGQQVMHHQGMVLCARRARPAPSRCRPRTPTARPAGRLPPGRRPSLPHPAPATAARLAARPSRMTTTPCSRRVPTQWQSFMLALSR